MDYLKKDNRDFFAEKDELMRRVSRYNTYVQENQERVKATLMKKSQMED